MMATHGGFSFLPAFPGGRPKIWMSLSMGPHVAIWQRDAGRYCACMSANNFHRAAQSRAGIFKARHARLENISRDFGAPSKSRPGFLARPEKLGRDFRSPLIIRPSFKRRPQSLAEIFQARHVCLEKFGRDLLVPSESRRSVLMRPENSSRMCQVTSNSLAEILGARQNPRRIF